MFSTFIDGQKLVHSDRKIVGMAILRFAGDIVEENAEIENGDENREGMSMDSRAPNINGYPSCLSTQQTNAVADC